MKWMINALGQFSNHRYKLCSTNKEVQNKAFNEKLLSNNQIHTQIMNGF